VCLLKSTAQKNRKELGEASEKHVASLTWKGLGLQLNRRVLPAKEQVRQRDNCNNQKHLMPPMSKPWRMQLQAASFL
jgi:hypothetical protein